jgi:cholesterol oxidase
MLSKQPQDNQSLQAEIFDFVVIGSGFGGSVSSLRLAEKGYRVLVIERGKRFEDADFPKSNWILWNYLWLPALHFYGFLEMSFIKDVVALHGSGVGGGSLVYACVLVEPDEQFYNSNPRWSALADWKAELAPHFTTAKRMLGVTRSPSFFPSDDALRAVAKRMGVEGSYTATDVGIYFDESGSSQDDPFFGGKGPERTGCKYCGGCMVGCRYNAKNTLVKNYLHLAESLGVQVVAETEALDCRSLERDLEHGQLYEITCRKSTGFGPKRTFKIRSRNVVFAAGVMGTLRLLFQCKEQSKSLPRLSPRLGDYVRTNSEALLGAVSDRADANHTWGIAIGSVFQADERTHVETFRFPEGSSFLYRLLGSPLLNSVSDSRKRLVEFMRYAAKYPMRFLDAKLNPSWGRRVAPLLVMQTEDNLMRLQPRKKKVPLFDSGLTSRRDQEKPIEAEIPIAHSVTRMFANEINGEPLGNIVENLFNIPITAHILGGCSIGRTEQEGVVDQFGRVFNYPGLYIADGSLMPANPGLNPSLTITSLAEYVMSKIPAKG